MSFVQKWKYLWTKVPRLKYNVEDYKNHTRFERFIDKSLLSHQSHILESLHVKVTITWNKNIGPWIRCLKLNGVVIDVEASLTTVSLPSLKTLHMENSSSFDFGSLQLLLSNCNSLTDLMLIRKSKYFFVEFDISWCKTLVALKLEGLKDVISITSSAVCLPFLKTLHVARMVNFNNDSLCRLLYNCPLLYDLTLEEQTSDVLLNLDISMTYLQRFSIITKVKDSTHLCSLLENYIRKLAIIAPSFKYFSIQEPLYNRYCSIVRVGLGDPSTLEDASIFCRIVLLELSIFNERSGEMLKDLLQCTIKLVVLKLKNAYDLNQLDPWEPPSLVPECLLSSLEALEWRGYTWRYGDNKNVVSYLLNHALHLKKAKIFYVLYPCDMEEGKQKIEEEFASMPRGSKLCELGVEEMKL